MSSKIFKLRGPYEDHRTGGILEWLRHSFRICEPVCWILVN